MKRIALEQVEWCAREHIDGHALHYMKVEEVQDYVLDGLSYQLRTWMMAEDVSPVEEELNLFKPMTFEFGVKTSTPASWWQMLKRDYAPTWFKKKWPVKYQDESHKRKVQTWVREKLKIKFKVKAVYPKLPEIYPECGPHRMEVMERSNYLTPRLPEVVKVPPPVEVKGSSEGEYTIQASPNVVIQAARRNGIRQ